MVFVKVPLELMVFSMVFFTSEPRLLMVFHILTIGIDGFCDGFFTVPPLPSMVFQWLQFILYFGFGRLGWGE